MSDTNENNEQPTSGAKVRLCGLYIHKSNRDGSFYLVGRTSWSSKLLITANKDKTEPRDPDFFAYILDEPKKSRRAKKKAAPATASGEGETR